MATRKPAGKPPIWLHPSGQWRKKHLRRNHYFGTDEDAAPWRFVAEWDDIKAGRPRQHTTGDVQVDLVPKPPHTSSPPPPNIGPSTATAST